MPVAADATIPAACLATAASDTASRHRLAPPDQDGQWPAACSTSLRSGLRRRRAPAGLLEEVLEQAAWVALAVDEGPLHSAPGGR